MGGVGGTTVWKGTAFDCPSSSHEIILLHIRFKNERGTHKACNNGTIVGQSLRVENTSYTSQLNVTVSSNMIGESIKCVHDDGKVATSVESSTIMPTTGTYNIYLKVIQTLYTLYCMQLLSHHLTICLLAKLILAQDILSSTGVQLPLTVLLSITTF